MKKVLIILSILAPLCYTSYVLYANVVSPALLATCLGIGIISMVYVLVLYSPPLVDVDAIVWAVEAHLSYYVLALGMLLGVYLKYAPLPEGTAVPLYLLAPIGYPLAGPLIFHIHTVSKRPEVVPK